MKNKKIRKILNIFFIILFTTELFLTSIYQKKIKATIPTDNLIQNDVYNTSSDTALYAQSIPDVDTKITISGDMDTVVMLTDVFSENQYAGILEADNDLIFKNLDYGTYTVSCINQLDVDFVGTDATDDQFTLDAENEEAIVTVYNQQTLKSGFYNIIQKNFVFDVVVPLAQLTITVEPDTVIIGQGSEYDILEGVIAVDTVDGDITSEIEVATDLDINLAGTYTATYTVYNTAGDVATATRTIIVEIPSEPVITVDPDTVTIQLGSEYNILEGVTAIDDIDGDITSEIITEPEELDIYTIGTYKVIYTVTNSSGITSTNSRTIIIEPSPPVITVIPETITIMQGYTYNILTGVTAIDDMDGDITSQITTESDLDINTLGTYTVTYTVTNSSEKTTIAERTIIVTDVPPPPLFIDLDKNKQPFIDQLPNDNTVKNYYLLWLISAIDFQGDDISSSIIVTDDDGFDPSAIGDYTISYEVTDSLTQTSTFDLTVTVWNFVKIDNGQYHGLALGSNGSVWSWGYNNVGQRGLGNTTSAASYRGPTQIPQSYFGNLPVIDITTGYLSSFALNSEGQTYAWGHGANYQLGNGATANQTRPVPVKQPIGIKFTQISSFYQTGAGLGDDGNVYTWGGSSYGANGSGSANKKEPSAIISSEDIKHISQGYHGGLAVNMDGQVYAWGSNVYGQMGFGSNGGYNYKPALVPSLSNIKEVSSGWSHMLALTNAGQVYAWGLNSNGRLGLGNTTNRPTPTLIPDLNNVDQINAAVDFSQFRVGNDIYSCGNANYGELFAGNTTARPTPYLSSLTNVAGNVRDIAGCYDNAYILSVDGKYVWGIGYCNTAGQQFGSTVTQATSTTVAIPWTFIPPPIPTSPKIIDANKNKHTFIDQIANDSIAKDNYLLGLVSATDFADNNISSNIIVTDDGGFDPSALGNYTISYKVTDSLGMTSTFTLKVTVWNFVKIVNGQYHSLALGSNGSVWSWGYNNVGQRGLGNTTNASNYRAPTQVPQSYFGNLPVIDIATGYSSSFALNSAGQTYAWGAGANYGLGNGATGNQTRPVAISQPSGVKFTQISSFYQTGAGLGNDGNIYTWGNGGYGAAGSGNTSNKTTPSAITSSGDFIQISQGYYGGAAVNSSGEVYTWGTNVEGEIGIGTTGGSGYSPTLVPSLSNIKEVSYGSIHVLALTNDGYVYAWGSGGNGRLGLGDTANKPTPTLIPDLSDVSKINAASDFSQFKVGNDIYSCGNANYGESFAGATGAHTTPYLSTMTNVAGNVGDIAGRHDNAYILSLDGRTVWGIGFCDSSGQEFGSTVTQSTSNAAVVPWTFTPQPAP